MPQLVKTTAGAVDALAALEPTEAARALVDMLHGPQFDWYFVSYADPRRGPGHRSLGGCYVRASSQRDAMDIARTKRLSPGGVPHVLGPLPAALIEDQVDPCDLERLLSHEELVRR